MDEMKKYELNDDELDAVVGGYDIGTTVHCRSSTIKYCKSCGRLMQNYDATITGVHGVLDGNTVYWITLNCCGYKTSVIETSITG